MYALTKMRASSRMCENKPVFNQGQKELLHTTTKYVSLLSFAMISTWITGTLFALALNSLLGNAFGNEIFTFSMMSINCLDGAINTICLYLQFRFSKKYYNRKENLFPKNKVPVNENFKVYFFFIIKLRMIHEQIS